MKYFCFFTVFLLMTAPLISTAQDKIGSFESIILGNYTRYTEERILFHPGLFTLQKNARFFVYYSRPFEMKELDTRSFLFTFPYRNTSFAVIFSSFGREVYNEQSASVISAHPVSKSVVFSAVVQTVKTNIPGFPAESDYSASFGALIRSSRILLGLRLLNAVSAGTAHTQTVSSKSVTIQAFLALTESFGLSVGYLKESGFTESALFESRLKLMNRIFLVSAVGINPLYYGGEAVLTFNRICFEYYVKEHSDLGTTIHCGIGFMLK